MPYCDRRRFLCSLTAITTGFAGNPILTHGTLAQTAVEQPKRGGTFVMALGANPDHLNLSISSSVIIALPSQTVTEGLITVNSKYELQPALATAWHGSINRRRGLRGP